VRDRFALVHAERPIEQAAGMGAPKRRFRGSVPWAMTADRAGMRRDHY
jgi:hypothetical protein